MNQIMPIGKGVLIALNGSVTREAAAFFKDQWTKALPDVPLFVINEAEIIEREEITLFSFTGDVSPTMVAEFQLWWMEVNGGNDKG